MHALRSWSIATLFFVGFTGATPAAVAAQTAETQLQGAWAAYEYLLADGARHAVRGRIIFTSGDWQVLFFVMDGDEPRRGSGEGGRYTIEDGLVTFEHLFHLSVGDEMAGLPASPLTLTARSGTGPLEPTDLEIDGDRLTLRFPSGNAMMFTRSSN